MSNLAITSELREQNDISAPIQYTSIQCTCIPHSRSQKVINRWPAIYHALGEKSLVACTDGERVLGAWHVAVHDRWLGTVAVYIRPLLGTCPKRFFNCLSAAPRLGHGAQHSLCRDPRGIPAP